MTNRKLLVFASAIAIAVVAFLVLLNRPTKGNQFKLAANLPLTGDLAVYGVSVRRGAELALDDFRAEEPGYNKIVIDWQDNASDPKTAVAVMQRQLAANPHLYTSGVRPQTMAIWDQVAGAHVPHFVWIFERIINPVSQQRNNLRTWVNLKDEARVYLEYVDKKKPKRVAILHTQAPSYQDEFDKDVIPGLKERGIEVFVETYPFEGADYRSLALKVAQFKPDLVIVGGWQSHLVALVRAIRPMGLIRDGNMITTYDLLDAAEVLGKEELEGVRFVAPTFVTRPNDKKVVAWVAKFERKYRVTPLYTDAYGYDMMLVIQDALKRLPHSATPKDWIDCLRSTNIEGITGQLKFDDDGSLVSSIEVGLFHEGNVMPEESSLLLEATK